MTQATAMPCPVCKVPLTMSERQGVEIDYCPQCRGVWLDRGELDKIIERSAQEHAPSPPQQRQPRGQQSGQHDLHGHVQHGFGHSSHPYKKRRKSFLEELFD